jgi:F420-non-reducing hydrogenase iron-sulfur subunit
MTSAANKGKGAPSPAPKKSPAKSKAKSGAKPKAAPKAKSKAKAKAKTAAKKKPAAASKPAVQSKPAAAPETPAVAVAAPKERTAAAKGTWNPRIVVFACNWCSYAGADTAGVSRIQHQPHFRMIRVMCSGRIQPSFVLHAFEKGADGVLVSGCHFGDCHYVFGNERAVEQFEITKNVVKLLGIEEGRLRLEWISAAEGVRFAEVINEFTEQVRALGPSPLAKKREAA